MMCKSAKTHLYHNIMLFTQKIQNQKHTEQQYLHAIIVEKMMRIMGG